MYTSGTGLSTYDMPLGLLLLYSMIICLLQVARCCTIVCLLFWRVLVCWRSLAGCFCRTLLAVRTFVHVSTEL
jgi:hypothetical protein